MGHCAPNRLASSEALPVSKLQRDYFESCKSALYNFGFAENMIIMTEITISPSVYLVWPYGLNPFHDVVVVDINQTRRFF